jgi:hypothetical protein
MFFPNLPQFLKNYGLMLIFKSPERCSSAVR